MVKRLIDVVVAAVALILLAPVLAVIALVVRSASPGPVFYRAKRAGRDGNPIVVHKFRTMHVGTGPSITAARDPRIFAAGAFLRRMKLDELPQLFDVLLGRMSLVGPRPEDLAIVEGHYGPGDRETLTVRPGMASPGSIFNFTHGDDYLDEADPVGSYVQRLLPLKLALDRVYVSRMSLRYDFAVIRRTVAVIVLHALKRRPLPLPTEMPEALRLLERREELV